MASQEREPLSFSLSLEEIPVTLYNPATGTDEEFVIRELSGKDRDSYLNTITKRARQLPDGTTRVDNFDGLQAELLTRSIFRVGEEKPVDIKTLQTWPAKVQSALFDRARELSGLDNEDAEKGDEGND